MNNSNILPEIYNHSNGNSELEEIINEIKVLKVEMEDLWLKKERTDDEVLEVSIRIDELLNKYYRFVAGLAKAITIEQTSILSKG